MNDHNRGQYPQERPLAFDDYRPQRRGGPAPVTLIVSMLILAGVGGGVFYLYRGGMRSPGGPPAPVGAPVRDVRIAAPPQPQAADPAAGLSIYKEDPNAVAGAPAFVAPPEQPTPRPVTGAPAAPAAAQTVAVAPSGAGETPEVNAPVVAQFTGTPKTGQAIKTESSVKAPAPVKLASLTKPSSHAKAESIDSLLAGADSGPPPRHASASADPADAKAKAKPDRAPGKVMVQIGAFSSEALADKGWNAAAGVAPGAMAGKAKRVAVVTKPDGTTLYRTSITGFSTREEAQALCARLVAAGKTCLVR